MGFDRAGVTHRDRLSGELQQVEDHAENDDHAAPDHGAGGEAAGQVTLLQVATHAHPGIVVTEGQGARLPRCARLRASSSTPRKSIKKNLGEHGVQERPKEVRVLIELLQPNIGDQEL